MSETYQVVCGAHGETPAAYVCRHVFTGVACGFNAKPPAPDAPWPDAWCDLCEEVFQAGGGKWNEELERTADIRVLCCHCYEVARDLNQDVPALARGAAARLTGDEADLLLHHAVHEGQALQDQSDESWGWKHMARWFFDDRQGTLTFSEPTRGKLITDARMVGSYSTRSSTFQWAWQTYDKGAREAALVSRLRVFGEVRGLSKLTTARWKCDQDAGWDMTAIAAYILGADALYRAQFDHQYWFMLLSDFRAPH